ncbi:putative non-specific serine/threonine protein kinase [Dioscorea sansibarensis]
MSMDLERIPQVNLWFGSTKKWRSGPWNGIAFSNIGEVASADGVRFDFVSNKDEVCLMYNTTGTKIESRAILDPSGMAKDFCEQYAKCGPYGVCDFDVWPTCTCSQGWFRPKSQQEWDLKDASSGCQHLTELDCKNRSDGFMTITTVALPETSNAILYRNINLNEECSAGCLNNCSCTAYATANISGAGNACVIWVTELIDLRRSSHPTQDVFVRLAAANLGKLLHDQLFINLTYCSFPVNYTMHDSIYLLMFYLSVVKFKLEYHTCHLMVCE